MTVRYYHSRIVYSKAEAVHLVTALRRKGVKCFYNCQWVIFEEVIK
jgi:hypothetical protein